MNPAMVSPRAPSLLIWLAAVLVMALGMVTPGAASAHAGHGEHAGRAAGHGAEPAPRASAPAFAAIEAIRAKPTVASATISMPDAATSIPCGGASCCTSGHGCCAAIPVAEPNAPAQPRTSPLRSVAAGLPPGVSASAVPEPPRLFR
jgi:hypothetical protein